MWAGGFKATPQLLYYWARHPVPIVQEAGWCPEPVWTGAENLAIPTGIQSPDRPAVICNAVSFAGSSFLSVGSGNLKSGASRGPPRATKETFTPASDTLLSEVAVHSAIPSPHPEYAVFLWGGSWPNLVRCHCGTDCVMLSPKADCTVY